MAKKGKKRQEPKPAGPPAEAVRDGMPGGVMPEQLLRHEKAPGDRAIDVLDNHTPDIDL